MLLIYDTKYMDLLWILTKKIARFWKKICSCMHGDHCPSEKAGKVTLQIGFSEGCDKSLFVFGRKIRSLSFDFKRRCIWLFFNVMFRFPMLFHSSPPNLRSKQIRTGWKYFAVVLYHFNLNTQYISPPVLSQR